ncbi:ATP-binding protein [Rhodococcus sp. T2V]|uniref:ATP-binding protein n=1 Tax=Rhodococcus sp. T2V TaxID=3034164 RepID=UPI0023E3181D|nr:ATP-binding protein [Rhodococcus sp. T2V]MDF3308750.1 ATP-binding protein [Rhodococcus sp. T2V]
MIVEFTPATRAAGHARILLCGPPGSGKTYTALALAHSLGSRVAVVDTQHGSASWYAGTNGWEFDTLKASTFSPNSLVEILGTASGREYDALVLDTWSSYWEGADGMLEQVDRRGRSGPYNSGWKEVRPEERRMIEALLTFPGHVIVTLRSKVEHVIEVNEHGRKEVRRVALKPIQRDGVEHDFDIVGDLDERNALTVSKTRFPLLAREVIDRPGAELAELVGEWLADGERRPTVAEYRDRALADDQTPATLRELYVELDRELMLGAPTLDGDGNPTVLGDLVANRGRALQAAAEAAGGAA